MDAQRIDKVLVTLSDELKEELKEENEGENKEEGDNNP
jgi:hypothetical protein